MRLARILISGVVVHFGFAALRSQLLLMSVDPTPVLGTATVAQFAQTWLAMATSVAQVTIGTTANVPIAHSLVSYLIGGLT